MVGINRSGKADKTSSLFFVDVIIVKNLTLSALSITFPDHVRRRAGEDPSFFFSSLENETTLFDARTLPAGPDTTTAEEEEEEAAGGLATDSAGATLFSFATVGLDGLGAASSSSLLATERIEAAAALFFEAAVVAEAFVLREREFKLDASLNAKQLKAK